MPGLLHVSTCAMGMEQHLGCQIFELPWQGILVNRLTPAFVVNFTVCLYYRDHVEITVLHLKTYRQL